MKRFIKNIIIFILPIVLIATIMDFCLRKIPNDYSYKKEYLDAHSNKIENLILGNSHSFYGINPVYFANKTFNASYVSQTLDYDYEILKKYKHNFKNLKTVIIPISYSRLFGKLEVGKESWRVKNYVIYYDMYTTNNLRYFTEILSNNLLINLNRLNTYYIKGRSQTESTKLGWGSSYRSENAHDLILTGKKAADRHTQDNINSVKYQNILNENIVILNSIIQWCEKNMVKVILFTPPAFETYRNHLNNEQLDVTISTTNTIALRYNNCSFINMMKDTRFVATDFYDADHLSEIGAEKLSVILNKKIVEPKYSSIVKHLKN